MTTTAPGADYIQLVGQAEMDKTIRSLIRQAQGPDVDTALMQGGFVLEEAIKRHIRDQQLIDTGNLRKSIRTALLRKKQVVVGTHVVYAAIHEFGGTIRAKNAPYLVFKVGKQWVRVKSVDVPPRPYMRPAFDKEHKKAEEKIRKTLQLAIFRQLQMTGPGP